jgi:hypothetical protein
MTYQIAKLPQYHQEIGLKTNAHFFIDEAYKKNVCATLCKPITGTMTTLLKEEPLD